MDVCIVIDPLRISKSAVMNVKPLFVLHVTGVMNIKQIMKLESATAVMHSIVETVMKWINVMTVGRSFVHPAARY